MRKTLATFVLAACWAGAQPADNFHGPLERMPASLEVRFALSALPPALRDKATVYVLDPAKGYVLERAGSNGQSCFVGRTEWKFADYRNDIYDPVCYDAVGAANHMHVWFGVAELRAKGVSPETVKKEIEARFHKGAYKAPDQPGLSYMTAPLMRTYMSLDPTGKNSVMTMSMPHAMYYAPNVKPKPKWEGCLVRRVRPTRLSSSRVRMAISSSGWGMMNPPRSSRMRRIWSRNSVPTGAPSACPSRTGLSPAATGNASMGAMSGAQDKNPHTLATHQAIEQAARDSYGRLLAFLTVRSHDMAAAEDALADAFKTALETWPDTGVPEKPEAWLLVAARRKLIDAVRHSLVHAAAIPDLLAVAEDARQVTQAGMLFPDERLKLLFVCAHPAIDAAARTPLMLQAVLGLDAARIASAFLVRPSAMGQRLTRAKAKIRSAGIRFEVPESKELPERLSFVLEAIYAAYGSGWDDVAGADQRRNGLAAEAIHLGRLLGQLMPAEPEVEGLLALMLHCEARQEARRTAAGVYVPLTQQDVTLWSKSMMDEAEHRLADASRVRRFGRFQFEAAIQSAHAQRARTGRTDWDAIALLYEGLVRIHPTIGALVGRAAAVTEAKDPWAGWAHLEAIPAEEVASYQPYWALAAHLLERIERLSDAEAAYRRAMGLCEDPAMREFLAERVRKLSKR